MTVKAVLGYLFQPGMIRRSISNVCVNSFAKGPFKYYVITFLTFLGPPTQLFDDLQYCKSSRIATF